MLFSDWGLGSAVCCWAVSRVLYCTHHATHFIHRGVYFNPRRIYEGPTYHGYLAILRRLATNESNLVSVNTYMQVLEASESQDDIFGDEATIDGFVCVGHVNFGWNRAL